MSAGVCCGDYELLELLGDGSGRSVWRALDGSDQRLVAVKRFAPCSLDPIAGLRLQQEIGSAFRLAKHRGGDVLVELLETGVVGDQYWVASELIDAPSLEDILATEDLTPDTIAELIRLAAEAVDALHERGLVHTNLKPANVFMDGPTRVRLGDPFLGVALGATLIEEELPLTLISHLAPELVYGAPPGPRSDQYALGVIAYRLLTGTLPYEASTSIDYLFAAAYKSPVALTVRSAALGNGLDEIVRRALETDPDDRFPTCTAFAWALLSYVDAAAKGDVGDRAARDAGADLTPRAGPEIEPEARNDNRARPPQQGLAEQASKCADDQSSEDSEPPGAKSAGSATPSASGVVAAEPAKSPPSTPIALPDPDELADAIARAAVRIDPLGLPSAGEETPEPEPAPDANADPDPGEGTGRKSPLSKLRPLWDAISRSRFAAVMRLEEPEAEARAPNTDWMQDLLESPELAHDDSGLPTFQIRELGVANFRVTPSWPLGIVTDRQSCQVWINGSYVSEAPGELLIRGTAGERVKLELRSSGATVASKEIVLHPLMSTRWDADDDIASDATDEPGVAEADGVAEPDTETESD